MFTVLVVIASIIAGHAVWKGADDDETILILAIWLAILVPEPLHWFLSGELPDLWFWLSLQWFLASTTVLANYRASRSWRRAFSHWRLVEKVSSAGLVFMIVGGITYIVMRLMT